MLLIQSFLKGSLSSIRDTGYYGIDQNALAWVNIITFLMYIGPTLAALSIILIHERRERRHGADIYPFRQPEKTKEAA